MEEFEIGKPALELRRLFRVSSALDGEDIASLRGAGRPAPAGQDESVASGGDRRQRPPEEPRRHGHQRELRCILGRGEELRIDLAIEDVVEGLDLEHEPAILLADGLARLPASLLSHRPADELRPELREPRPRYPGGSFHLRGVEE